MYYIRSKSLDVLAANTRQKNTKFVRRKYHYTADILFYCFGIYRTSKSVDNFNIHKKVAEYKRYNLASFHSVNCCKHNNHEGVQMNKIMAYRL